jgi:effector-binding domain-containing protein
MKFLKKCLIALVVVIVVLGAIGFMLPASQQVERSVVINAPQSVVFAQVNGLRHFNQWSPYVALMPNAEYRWSGPDFGVGSSISWTVPGANGATAVRTIVNSVPYERVDVEIDRGRQGPAQETFVLRTEDGGTRLTWTFDTDFGLDLVSRFFGLFLDRELGPVFAQGLANVERIAEDLPAVDWSELEIGLTEVPSQTIAFATGSAGLDADELAEALAAAYGRVAVFATANGLTLSGQPMAVFNYRDDRGFSFDAAIPVDGALSRGVGSESPVRMGESYGGRVVRAVHVGAYGELPLTYDKAKAFIAAHRLEGNGRPWDVYVTDPANTPEDQLRTEVYYPVK